MTLGSNADWLSLGVNQSTTFAIENIQLLYDAYALDEAVLDSFYKALLANRVLSIPTITVYQVVQTIPANSTSFSFAAVRAFSRLSHVWLTFRSNGGAISREFICPTLTSGGGDSPQLADGAPSARLSIGPKNWPDASPATRRPSSSICSRRRCRACLILLVMTSSGMPSRSSSMCVECPQTPPRVYRPGVEICSSWIFKI